MQEQFGRRDSFLDLDPPVGPPDSLFGGLNEPGCGAEVTLGRSDLCLMVPAAQRSIPPIQHTLGFRHDLLMTIEIGLSSRRSCPARSISNGALSTVRTARSMDWRMRWFSSNRLRSTSGSRSPGRCTCWPVSSL